MNGPKKTLLISGVTLNILYEFFFFSFLFRKKEGKSMVVKVIRISLEMTCIHVANKMEIYIIGVHCRFNSALRSCIFPFDKQEGKKVLKTHLFYE